MVPEPFAVRSRRQDTVDTWTLELEPRSTRQVSFAPGQFTMLSARGTGEAPISISGDPSETAWLVQTVRAVGPATRAICAGGVGATVGVRGPFGGAWPVSELEGADIVVAAGGLGLAPLRPAILSMLARRERYGRMVLLYGGRSPKLLLYTEELREWEQRGLEVSMTVDSAGPDWLGRVGVVTRLVDRADVHGEATRALVCGPEVMMRFTVSALERRGIAPDHIYVSVERNMQCGIGHCGHCQLGPSLICRDGPIYPWSQVGRWLLVREL